MWGVKTEERVQKYKEGQQLNVGQLAKAYHIKNPAREVRGKPLPVGQRFYWTLSCYQR